MHARLGAVVAAAVLTVSAGCGSDSSDSRLDRETLADATVRVRADGCGPRTELGTGTVIADGLVVTAAHVVAGADRVEVVDGLGVRTASTVVMFDPELDVAALRPIADVAPPAALRTQPGRQGEEGLVALLAGDGSVEVVPIEVLQRVTIETTDIYSERPVQRLGLRVSVTLEPGDSGAMVHLPGGGAGIVWSRSTSTNAQAWTVDLPASLSEPAARRALTAPVATGACR